MEYFDLTPTPQLLTLIGQIPFKGWQCIAELIDNSIDALQPENFKYGRNNEIFVVLPKKSKIKNNESIIIEDFGIGMTEIQLENAVRAGYTNKDTKSNLGLFGMGFNVATSRLANVAEVWTSTKEMDFEIGVRIDLRDMANSNSFIRPKLKRDKKPGKISGTEIRIFDYKANAENFINEREIKEQLTKAYSSSIFEKRGIRIKVNNDYIRPFKFCTWSSKITTKYKDEEIPAFIEIDDTLKEELFCENCFTWVGKPLEENLNIECPSCHNSNKVIKKQIAITGWVGIQRFTDMTHFGINISRNGRILSHLDKSFFTWQDIEGKNLFEYPIDSTYAGGRIVGEIEANFIVPEYTKDNFVREDKNWILAVECLRGKMPLQPEIAKKYGFHNKNRSPISLLFSGFRKVSPPGSKTLIFGKSDGSADYQTPRNWAQRFYAGEEEYESDEKWWEEVKKADLKENEKGFNPLKPNATSVTLPTDKNLQVPLPEKYPGRKTLKDNLNFNLEKLLDEKPIDIILFDYYPETDIDIPLIFIPKGQAFFHVLLNKHHSLFRDFADGSEDLIYMEVANKFSNLKNNELWPTSRIYYELKLKYASETMLNVPILVNKATHLMKDIQNYFIKEDGFELNPPPTLEESDLFKLKKEYLSLERKNLYNIEKFTSNSKFVKYLDLKYLFNFIKLYPNLLFDGKLFELPYEELDPQIKEEQLEKYIGYFNDVKWFMLELSGKGDEVIRNLKNEIIRNRYSIEILNGSIIRRI